MNMLKILIIAIALCIVAPACVNAAASGTPAEKAAPAEARKEEKKDAEKDAPATDQAAEKAPELAPGEYACKYYKVKLPDGWRAIMPPREEQGNINAIFATDNNSTVVTMVVGPNGGADAKMIAGMFAEQFKATRAPAEKSGVMSFTFPGQGGQATAYVATQDKQFLMATVQGNSAAGLNFLRKNVTTRDWAGLLPK